MATFHNSLNGDVQPYFMHWLDLILAIVTTSVKLASKITHFPSYYVIILVPNYLVKKIYDLFRKILTCQSFPVLISGV